MKQTKLISEIVNAAQSESVFMAALSYMKLGFSVPPLNGKRPACPEWKQYQEKAAEYQTIRNWVAQADRDEGRREDGLTTPEREELGQLRRDNRRLREEREILKKAAVWFARETESGSSGSSR